MKPIFSRTPSTSPQTIAAAEDLRLPFYERKIPAAATATAAAKLPQVAETGMDNSPRNLAADLAKLRFREIRMRTLLGSLNGNPHILSEESPVIFVSCVWPVRIWQGQRRG